MDTSIKHLAPSLSLSQGGEDIDAIAQLVDQVPRLRVADRLDTPPADNVPGDHYLVVATATDAWTGFEDYVAVYITDVWAFVEPREGMEVWNDADQTFYRY